LRDIKNLILVRYYARARFSSEKIDDYDDARAVNRLGPVWFGLNWFAFSVPYSPAACSQGNP
jgi:hypothetical protein